MTQLQTQLADVRKIINSYSKDKIQFNNINITSASIADDFKVHISYETRLKGKLGIKCVDAFDYDEVKDFGEKEDVLKEYTMLDGLDLVNCDDEGGAYHERIIFDFERWLECEYESLKFFLAEKINKAELIIE